MAKGFHASTSMVALILGTLNLGKILVKFGLTNQIR